MLSLEATTPRKHSMTPRGAKMLPRSQGASDAHIDAVLLLYKAARSCTHHRDENQIELSTLRAVNRENLVLNAILCEVLSNSILLRVIGRNYVDRILRELLDREARDLGCNAKRVSHDAKAVFF